MKKDIGGIEYDENEALSYGAENYPEITYPETEVCILDTKSITTSNPEIEDYEAKFVAQRVKQLIDTKQPVTNKDGTLRPCRYSDIAVLLRKKKNAELFVKELEKLNIPAKFEEGFGFYMKTEIATILNLLKIIDNPLKEVEMVAFCDIILEKAEKAVKEFGAPGAKAYEDYKELLKDETIDVVHVCTPNRSHSFITIDALESGKLKVIDSDIPRQFYYSKVLSAKNKWISPFKLFIPLDTFPTAFNTS